MIYIFTALYCEAQMFIEQYHLKKRMDSTCFQQFYSEEADILLTVSGTGEIAAAAAVSSVCTKEKPGQGDFLLNAGICAGSCGKEGIFLASKLTEQATGKTFYPDMLYRHCFQEAELLTGMKQLDAGIKAKMQQNAGEAAQVSACCSAALQADLYDMEAAAVYQAGAYFFAPHQMLFLKIISDYGEGRRLTAVDARQCIGAYKDSITAFLEQLLKAGRDRMHENADSLKLEAAVEKWSRRLSMELHCSKTMEHTLRQYIRHALLTKAGETAIGEKMEDILEDMLKNIIEEMYREHRLPCRDKREGKQCFEALKQRLL